MDEEKLLGRNVFSKFSDKSCVLTGFFSSGQSPTRLEDIMSMPVCNFSIFQLIIKSLVRTLTPLKADSFNIRG